MSHCEPYILFVMPHEFMLHVMLCDMSHMLCYKIRNRWQNCHLILEVHHPSGLRMPTPGQGRPGRRSGRPTPAAQGEPQVPSRERQILPKRKRSQSRTCRTWSDLISSSCSPTMNFKTPSTAATSPPSRCHQANEGQHVPRAQNSLPSPSQQSRKALAIHP
jgi:hypothetical protein